MRMVKLVPLKKKKGGIRPIGISEPFSKVTEKLWISFIEPNAKRILSPFQFGCFFKSGGEGLCRSFQYENDCFQESIAKVDGKNFFNFLFCVRLWLTAQLTSPKSLRTISRASCQFPRPISTMIETGRSARLPPWSALSRGARSRLF